jgi:hypothetical protein
MNSAIEVIANVQMTWDRRTMMPFLLCRCGFVAARSSDYSLTSVDKKNAGLHPQLCVHAASVDQAHRPGLRLIELPHHRQDVEQHSLSEELAQLR